MPRYFFHVLNHIRTQDHDGVELPDIETARREALKDVDDIKRENFVMLDKNAWARWSIEICDEEGAVLLVVPFSEN
jgi:hypothetical protein